VFEIVGETEFPAVGVYVIMNGVPDCVVLMMDICRPPSAASIKPLSFNIGRRPRPEGKLVNQARNVINRQVVVGLSIIAAYDERAGRSG
jgi:hypothetical protein